MIFSELGRQAISRADFRFAITAVWVRTRILCLCVPLAEGEFFEARVDLSSHRFPQSCKPTGTTNVFSLLICFTTYFLDF